MKKFGFLLLWVTLTFSCNQETSKKNIPGMEFFEENPISIKEVENIEGDIESFQTEVTVYSMNNRMDISSRLQTKYKLSLKKINGVQYSRLDFFPEFTNGLARSVISDDVQMILGDPNTKKIECRVSLQNPVSKDLSFLGMETGISRINLDLIKKEAKRLSLDIIDDTKEAMVIDIPKTYFCDNSNEQRVSTRVMFDVTNETLSQIEVVMILQDGTTVTTNTYPMYQEIEDIPIKIGSVTVINSKAKEFLPGFENVEYFESIDDIPEISEQEYNSLLESETTEKVESLLFGNPADLSYEETIVEVYNNIEINTIEDSLFKIFINNE